MLQTEHKILLLNHIIETAVEVNDSIEIVFIFHVRRITKAF